MNKTLICCTDPEAAVMVTKQSGHLQRVRSPRQRIRLDPAIYQSAQPSAGTDQNAGLIVLEETSKSRQPIFHFEKLGSAWFPPPKTIRRSQPKISCWILIRRENHRPKKASLALNSVGPISTQLGNRRWLQRADPNCAITILEQAHDPLAVQLRVSCELPVFETREPLLGSNPERSIAGNEQGSDQLAGKSLTGWRLPFRKPSAIRTHQAKFRAQPQIAVRRLCNRENYAFCEPVADLPRSMGVLADVERRIESGSASAPRQQDARQHPG